MFLSQNRRRQRHKERAVTDKNGKSKDGRRNEQPAGAIGEKWVLRLYVAGETPKALTALKNLSSICEDKLKGKYHIEVIDLFKNPRLARDNQILAVPTLAAAQAPAAVPSWPTDTWVGPR